MSIFKRVDVQILSDVEIYMNITGIKEKVETGQIWTSCMSHDFMKYPILL